MKEQVYEFTGLFGVRGGKLHGPIVRSQTEANKALKKHRLVSAAGDFGALNIWKDDERKYRAEFCQYRNTAESRVFKTKKAALEWFKIWFRVCKGRTE